MTLARLTEPKVKDLGLKVLGRPKIIRIDVNTDEGAAERYLRFDVCGKNPTATAEMWARDKYPKRACGFILNYKGPDGLAPHQRVAAGTQGLYSPSYEIVKVIFEARYYSKVQSSSEKPV